MHEWDCIYAIVGGFILIFALVSMLIKERIYLSETLLATLMGMFFGDSGFGFLNLENFFGRNGMYQISRVVLSLQLIAVGMVVPRGYVFNAFQSILMMIGPLMIFSYFITACLVHFICNLNWTYAFIIGACVAPTDPVLANSVIKGKFATKYVPLNIRKLICFESGANDGLALPLLQLPILFLIKKGEFSGISFGILRVIFYEVGFSIIIGCLIGFVFRFLLNFSRENDFIDKESFLAYTIALSFFITGLSGLMAVDDLFACFICGVVFSWYDEDTISEVKESHLIEVIDMILNLTFFVFFGSQIKIAEITFKELLLCFFILLLRRLPLVYGAKAYIGELKNYKEAFFVGWFGPIGVGAIFFIHHAKFQLNDLVQSKVLCGNEIDALVKIVYLIVTSSVFVHGITAPIIHFHLKTKNTKQKIVILPSLLNNRSESDVTLKSIVVN